MDIKTFKTGRHYSGNGQRIAYLAVDGGFIMVDVDRNIDYYFATKLRPEWLTNQIVLSIYDRGGDQCMTTEARALLPMLRAAAEKI